MAKKPRTRAVPFDNTATEASPGEWSWVLKGRTWRWVESHGINLSIVHPAGNVTQLAWIRSLREAAMFAEGFTAGYTVAERKVSTSVPPIDLEIQSDTTPAEPIGPGGSASGLPT
jgi:hypothetical protein